MELQQNKKGDWLVPSLEEQYIEFEGVSEAKAEIKDYVENLRKFVEVFLEPKQFEIYYAVKVGNMNIRKAAMTFHMSRYNIRKNCKETQEKINSLLALAKTARKIH